MVIIKDFKMPESCSDCPICYDTIECPVGPGLFDNWRLADDVVKWYEENPEWFITKRHLRCPLEERTALVQWIWDDFGYHCSECYYHVYGNTDEVLSGEYKFCPHCGAEMGGEAE